MTDHPPLPTAAKALSIVLETFSTTLAQVTRANELPDAAGGFRPENDAEHSFELALVAIVIADVIDPELDRGLVARLALVHDLEEVYCGDVSVYDPASTSEARAADRAAASARVLDDLARVSPAIAADLRLYLDRSCDEARFVYALDKIVPFFRVLQNGRHHARPSTTAYEATAATARSKVAEYPKLLPVFDHVHHTVATRLSALNNR